MGSTSKKNAAANLEALWRIQPNGSPPGSGSGGAGGSVTGDANAGMQPIGRKEHVPQYAFVAQPRRQNDDFLNTAFDYHVYFLGAHDAAANRGGPRHIRSMAHLLQILHDERGHGAISRLRIVTHAHPRTVMLAMFDGGQRQLPEEMLNEYAKGNGEGVIQMLFNLDGPYDPKYKPFNVTSIFSRLRGTAANVPILAPFGAAVPTDGLLYLFVKQALNRSFSQIPGAIRYGNGNNPGAINGTRRGILAAAFDLALADFSERLERAGTMTAAQATAARTLLGNLTVEQLFGPTVADPGWFSYGVPTDGNGTAFNLFNFFRDETARAAAAFAADFRAHLETARGRFSATSFVDLRGCRVGRHAVYMEAFRTFFGASAAQKPSISGANWYQIFARVPIEQPSNNAEIQTLLRRGARDNDARQMHEGFQNWSDLAHIAAAHRWFWLEHVQNDTIRFARLEWRNHFPPLQFATPGLTALAGLGFRPALERIAQFFHCDAAALPASAAVWTTLTDFVNARLPGLITLFAESANPATPAARLIELHTALRAADQQLGANVVPAAAPVGLNHQHVADWQTALRNFLDGHQLLSVRTLMNAVRDRIQDDAVPSRTAGKGAGWHYYMLHAGLPVFIVRNLVTANQQTHQVTRQHAIFVALDAHATAAVRAFAPVQWAEALPAANGSATATAAQQNARLVISMVRDGGPDADDGPRLAAVESPAAYCPFSEYMDQIRTVPEPPAPPI